VASEGHVMQKTLTTKAQRHKLEPGFVPLCLRG
jgi:hypothetical protein